MPEIVDDAKDEAMDNWKPALAYGAATGFGDAFAGPIGQGAGAVLAGSYIGGDKGDTITVVGAGDAFGDLIRMGMSGGGGGGNNSGTTEV